MSSLQVPPLNFYKKDRELFKHIAKDNLTGNDLLRIEYGEFPMKGINITHQHEEPVHVRNLLQDKKSSLFTKILGTLMYLGYVRNQIQDEKDDPNTPKDRNIFLNKIIYSPLGQYFVLKNYHLPLAKGIGMLATGATTLAKVGLAAINALKQRVLLTAMLLSGAAWPTVVQLMTLPFRSTMNTVGHEHVHIMQLHDEAGRNLDLSKTNMMSNLKDHLPKPLKIVSTLKSVFSLGMIPYWCRDNEVQARMHTILANGYRHKWHRLPETKHEFWGAMISMGMSAPSSIHQELKNSPEAGVRDFYKPDAKTFFNRAAGKCTNGDVSQLNAACSSLLQRSLKEKYWQEVLPILYGHLLELYGDPTGRARLGAETDNLKIRRFY